MCASTVIYSYATGKHLYIWVVAADGQQTGWYVIDLWPYECARELRERSIARTARVRHYKHAPHVCAEARPAGRHGRVVREHLESVLAGLRHVQRDNTLALLAHHSAREHLCALYRC